MHTTEFDPADLATVIDLYHVDDAQKKADETCQLPWTWAALSPAQASAMGRLIDVFAATYNRALATETRELVPPCWRQHEGLATELLVVFWSFYAVHWHAKATPLAAFDFYGRHLPGFRGRVEKLLGNGAKECQEGRHVPSWRKEIDDAISRYASSAETPCDVSTLTGMHFGFRPM